MQLSNITAGPYRPQIKRLAQKDLPLPPSLNEFDSPSISSTKKWLYDQRSRVPPEFDNSWIHHNKPRKDPRNNNNKNKLARKTCFWIIIAIILFIIVGAIIGIVLGLTLHSSTNNGSSTTMPSDVSATTNSTSATTTISIICSTPTNGLIALQNGPTTWTSYSQSFVATKTASTLEFGFQTDGTNSFYLDSVSVVNTAAPSNQLLVNPNFENSTTSPPTGWSVSCEMTSCGAPAAFIDTSFSQCLSGNCFESFCSAGRSALIFLSQTFATINGNSYSISFMLKQTNIPSSGSMIFYLVVD